MDAPADVREDDPRINQGRGAVTRHLVGKFLRGITMARRDRLGLPVSFNVGSGTSKRGHTGKSAALAALDPRLRRLPYTEDQV
jgi:hypothetical protein